MFSSSPRPDSIKGWVCIYETSMDYDANLAKNFLEDCGYDCQILSKRDSAYNLNVGDMAVIFLYVRAEDEAEAIEAIKEWHRGDHEIHGDQ